MKVNKDKYKTQAYWDKLLQDCELTMERGRNSRVSYVGGTEELDRIGGQQQAKNGRTLPKSTA